MKKNIITVFAGTFGNVVEWYDFTIYAFFAPILATLFFPTHNSFTSLLMTFGVFAVGFLIRPLGGVLFGYVGDHFGRRKALLLSMCVMSIPTLLVAILPTYSMVGILAPLLLTLLRLVQGTAISGELTTATSFMVEHAAPNKRGLAGSLVMCSAFAGIGLSAAVAALITNIFSQSQVANWGWRVGFLLGGLLGIIGLIIRIFSHETALYQQTSSKQSKKSHSITKHFMGLNWKLVLIATLLTCTMAVGNYYLVAYFNTLLIKSVGLPAKEVLLINLVSILFFCILLPLMGILSDKLGRKIILGAGMLSLLVFAHPIFGLLTQGSIWYALIAQLLFIIFLAPIAGVIPTALAELFETKSRNMSLSVGYNLSLAIFGGTAPMVALTIVDITKSLSSPAWYLMLCAPISLLALLSLAETHKKKLT